METAAAIAAQVRSGSRSARDVVEASLAAIDAHDRGIGAFQVVDADAARRAADELATRPDLAELPLAGVPVAIKDNFDVAGLPTRHGSAATSAQPVPIDDELVRRLKAAGAIVVGKTKMPELAIWGFTESIAHGGTRNPRDPDRNAGGSTGGGAAAVAAGMVPLALGSDGGGSLRIPSAYCGVVGFKPAHGVLPLAGGVAEHWYGCSACGPIAATVDDVRLAMDVLAGGLAWRASSWPPMSLRVALSTRSPSPVGPASRPARGAVALAGLLAGRAGHSVSQANPSYPLMLANIWSTKWLAGIAEEVERLSLPQAELEPRTRTMARLGQRIRRRNGPQAGPGDAWRDAAARWFTDVDVLISPVVAQRSQPIGWGARTSFARAYLNGARVTPFTQAWNVAGFPALSLPLGGAGAGHSVQLVTAPGREDRLFALAATLAELSTQDA